MDKMFYVLEKEVIIGQRDSKYNNLIANQKQQFFKLNEFNILTFLIRI